MKWISVKEVLPMFKGTYICWERQYSGSTGNIELGYFDGKGFRTSIAEDYTDVTHWMRQPERPERPGPPKVCTCLPHDRVYYGCQCGYWDSKHV